MAKRANLSLALNQASGGNKNKGIQRDNQHYKPPPKVQIVAKWLWYSGRLEREADRPESAVCGRRKSTAQYHE
jgi:hypothetical protein